MPYCRGLDGAESASRYMSGYDMLQYPEYGGGIGIGGNLSPYGNVMGFGNQLNGGGFQNGAQGVGGVGGGRAKNNFRNNMFRNKGTLSKT